MANSDSLVQYLNHIRQASDLNLKWLVCKKNKDEEWEISLPSAAGFYSEEYLIVSSELEEGGSFKIAIPNKLGSRHKKLIVRVPDSIEVLRETECELIAVREA